MSFSRSFFAGIALASLAFFGSISIAQAAEALDTFQTRHSKVIQLIQEKAPNDKLQVEVDNLLDYHALAEAALGGPLRHPGRCEPRCAEFETLLAKLIRENYLKRIRSDKKYELTYVGEEKRPRHSRVTTTIKHVKNGKEEVVEVVYVMHKVGDDWKVMDIITEGVSLAKNYKYEFNKILKEKGIDELILRLENKLTELAKKD